MHRIFTCLMARAIQDINLRAKIFSWLYNPKYACIVSSDNILRIGVNLFVNFICFLLLSKLPASSSSLPSSISALRLLLQQLYQ
jgi:hypothetical protein